MTMKSLFAATLIATSAVGATLFVIRPAPELPQAIGMSALETAEIRAELQKLRGEFTAIAAAPTPTADDAPADRSNDAKYVAMTVRLADTERQLAALQRSTGAMPSGAPDLSQEEQVAAARAAREELEQQEEAHTLALQNALEAQFFGEDLDPQWARQTQESISRDFLGGGFSGSQLTELQCQSNLCRMQVHSTDGKAHERMIMGYTNIDAFANSQVFWSRDDQPDGSSLTTLYLMREGSTVPAVEQLAKSG